jgi:monoamine oxidase
MATTLQSGPFGPGASTIVVGGGLAGLYFTWRMLRANPNASITILEQLNRTGGRLDTDVVYVNNEPVKNEEGGMRFTQEMTNLMWLLQTLGRDNDIMPFSMGDDNNIYYLRGKRFTFGQMNADPSLWSTIYNLLPAEQNKQPNDILKGVLEFVLSQNNFAPPKTPGDWQNFRLTCTYRNIPLYQWGFWALLVDYGLSQECLQMIEDSMGFLAFYDQEVNAGVGFQTMGDFDNLPQYLTLTPGYETLATTMTNQIQAMGATIALNVSVQGFDMYDGIITVNTSSGPYQCIQLVLALPSLPLQLLAVRSPVLRENAQFMADIDTVTSMPLTKINLYFQERWWFTRYNVSAGGSFTDMAMGQFYCYVPILNDAPTGPASMTIYCDFDRTGYWDALQQIGTPFAPTNGWTQPLNSTPASSLVVEAAMRQLALFFGDQNLPPPMLSTYVGWGTSPTGDGDHSWKVGVNDQEVMARLQSPVSGEVYTCGEAYSDEQAWVDGALRSTEALLQQWFGLPPYNS